MTSTYNYGATLQAYALHEFVKSLGYDCDIIDHMSAEERHRTVKLNDFSRENLKKIPYKLSLETGYRRFEDFYDRHMNMTKRYVSAAELKTDPPDSDVFISGSDQVWNPKDPKLDRFLLDFAPEDKCKISYAASMGNPTLPDDKKECYVKALKRFDAISVREQEAHAMLQPLTEKEVQIHCDPAFLLTAEQWRALESPVKGLKENGYILCYMLHLPSWFNAWAERLKKETSLPIVFVGLQGYRPVFCDRYVRDAGPGEFLWLIDHADTVVSSSFHGNVFSLIFGTKLISTPDQKRPDRIRNLLRMFGEERREISSPDIQWDYGPFDNGSVSAIINSEREKAKRYFLKYISVVAEG